MEKIALITDSACDINKDLIDKFNINVLPFKIIFSDKEYSDGIDITPSTLYERLKSEVPTTSLPGVDLFINTLEKLKSEGFTHAIIITISNKLSGTINAARIAAETVSGIKTHVFDTLTLTMGQGQIVLNTAKLIADNKNFDEIVNTLPIFRERMDVFFTIDTLEYLKKGGRIGRVAGTIAEALNLKPIITVGDDGVYRTVAKIRGIKQSISRLSSILKDQLKNNKCNVWILHGNAPDKAQLLYDSIKDLNNLSNCTISGMIGPALAVHTGPGLIGLIIERCE